MRFKMIGCSTRNNHETALFISTILVSRIFPGWSPHSWNSGLLQHSLPPLEEPWLEGCAWQQRFDFRERENEGTQRWVNTRFAMGNFLDRGLDDGCHKDRRSARHTVGSWTDSTDSLVGSLCPAICCSPMSWPFYVRVLLMPRSPIKE